jgi:hypothetical protein
MAVCLPLSSFWVRMAPVANADALTCRKKGLLRLGCRMTGLERTIPISVFNASWHFGVHIKVWFFFVKVVRGHVILA